MDTTFRNLKYLVIALLVGGAVYFIARPFLLRSSDMAWEHTVATFPNSGTPQALVHGWTNTPLAECHFSLLWKAGDDKWLVYDIDVHGASWNRYQLSMENDLLSIAVSGKPVALFDPHKGEFIHLSDKQVDKTPVAVIHGANLEHELQWVYYSGGK